MSTTAVLRAAYRALRGPSSFRRAPPVVGESPMLREMITSRRLYSSADHKQPKLNKGLHDSPAVAERMASKADNAIASCDRIINNLCQIEAFLQEDYNRRLKARGRRVLLGGVGIIVSAVVYLKKRCSNKINKAAVDQEKAS